jgi:hypothetical protein
VSDVEAKTRRRQVFKELLEFVHAPAHCLALIHVFDEKRFPKLAPALAVENHIRVNHYRTSTIYEQLKALNYPWLLFSLEAARRMNRDKTKISEIE